MLSIGFINLRTTTRSCVLEGVSYVLKGVFDVVQGWRSVPSPNGSHRGETTHKSLHSKFAQRRAAEPTLPANFGDTSTTRTESSTAVPSSYKVQHVNDLVSSKTQSSIITHHPFTYTHPTYFPPNYPFLKNGKWYPLLHQMPHLFKVFTPPSLLIFAAFFPNLQPRCAVIGLRRWRPRHRIPHCCTEMC
jgi:hypothetical protein